MATTVESVLSTTSRDPVRRWKVVMKYAKLLMMLSLVVVLFLCPALVFAAGERAPVIIGEVAGWEDVEIMGSMVEYLIQKIGYPVEVIYADLGVLLTGLSEGDIDLYPGLCLPVCHERDQRQLFFPVNDN